MQLACSRIRPAHVFDKLGVFSRLELALFAINHGLVADSLGNSQTGL
jgi:hypothetical protein